jgi:hypothetical protein
VILEVGELCPSPKISFVCTYIRKTFKEWLVNG